MDFQSGYYQNKKNGLLYFAEKLLTNATNINDGQKMVEYYPKVNGNVQFSNGYVREISEFMTKFERVNVD
jgi:hypothetical protein